MSENFSAESIETPKTEKLSEDIQETIEKSISDEEAYEDNAEKMAAEAAKQAEEFSKLSTISTENEFKDDEEFIETNLDFAQELDNPDELIQSQEQFGFNDTNSENTESFDITPQAKKYVVAVTPGNIPFFDKYDPEERADLVNELLALKQEELKQQNRSYRLKKLTKHLLIAALTTLVGLPLIFTFVNKSIEATLNNYQEVQNSFEKLYIQKGGVKKKDMSKYRDLEY